MKTNQSQTSELAAGHHVGSAGIKSPAVSLGPRASLQDRIGQGARAGKGAKQEDQCEN